MESWKKHIITVIWNGKQIGKIALENNIPFHTFLSFIVNSQPNIYLRVSQIEMANHKTKQTRIILPNVENYHKMLAEDMNFSQYDVATILAEKFTTKTKGVRERVWRNRQKIIDECNRRASL